MYGSRRKVHAPPVRMDGARLPLRTSAPRRLGSLTNQIQIVEGCCGPESTISEQAQEPAARRRPAAGSAANDKDDLTGCGPAQWNRLSGWPRSHTLWRARLRPQFGGRAPGWRRQQMKTYSRFHEYYRV